MLPSYCKQTAPLALLLILIFGVSCSKEPEPLEFTYQLMDDYVTVVVPESERDQFTKIVTLSRERMEETAALFDNDNPKSEISRINRLSERVRFPISFETSRILRFAKNYYAQSEGAFDISIYPLAYMWGFNGGVPPGNVSMDVVKASIESVGLDKIDIFEGSIELRSPFSRIDLSGLVEGYLVDLAILRLRKNNFPHVFIQYGNSMRSLGMDDSMKPWSVPVPHPYESGSILGHLSLKKDAAASYSYIFGETVDNDGEVVTHILDPRSGAPATDTIYTLAVGPTGHMTDALSTTLAVQGLTGAPAMLKNFDERCEALVIPNRQPLELWVSENMLDYFSPSAAHKDSIKVIQDYMAPLEEVTNPKLNKILNYSDDDEDEFVPMPSNLDRDR